VITVLSVIAALIDRVPQLKKKMELWRSIEKIETLRVELKIANNFGGVNCNFPKNQNDRITKIWKFFFWGGGGCIAKIKTFEIKLKIAPNFRG
jgi:hypothetical protein